MFASRLLHAERLQHLVHAASSVFTNWRLDGFAQLREHEAARANKKVAAQDAEQWDRDQYLRTRKALVLLQRVIRRRRWRQLLTSRIPVVRGPCGFQASPIYRGKVFEGIEGVSGKVYTSTSWGCLEPMSPLRFAMIVVVESPWFEPASLTAVIANCIILALQGPPRDSSDASDAHSFWLSLAESTEFGFTLFFTTELLCRSIAMGIWGHAASYLADAWNRLDAFVVFISWMPLLFPSLENYTAMRGVRALRPLRTINRLPGMRRQARHPGPRHEIALRSSRVSVAHAPLPLLASGGYTDRVLARDA